MTQEEIDYVRNVGKWFYGSPPGQVTPQLAQVVAEMMLKVVEGSKAMHLVPRPTGGPPGVTWLLSQAVQAWWRVHHEEKVYYAVKVAVAAGYRSTYAMAEMGL
ncbi:MAG: hypothetical protein IPK82_22750 [Polyangiaceae bacterium]|nr:hypothetical protein [Polyangiaceae bacterium]